MLARQHGSWKNPIKSASDYRDYGILNLENGIKVLLVSDIKPSIATSVANNNHGDVREEDETRSAACALYIGAGSFDEPEDVGGLAHFLEHMLFMGSEKFPDENGYDSYLNMHGGSSNAYTTDEATVYYFDVQPEYFDNALDMFSNFFVNPLLTEDAMGREVKAVDSEFRGRIPDDEWRTDQVMRRLARTDHPYSRFTHGNKRSLVTLPAEQGIDVMDRLRAFFNNVYSCKQITLSLCAPIPLQNLETMAQKYFSPIAPRSAPQLLHNSELEDPYRVGQFHKLVVIAPVEEIHLIKLCWLLPPQQRHYKKKPADYVAWLLTHECQGSVYACLKSKGYICSMDAYCSTDFAAFSQFYCSAELTEKGMDNVHEVIHTIFQYIAMISRHGASRDIFDQLSKISDHCFKYKEPEEPCDLVESLVEQMNYYDDDDCLSGSCVFEEFDAELIEEVQKMLTPTDVNIILLSKKYKHECDQVEEWFKSKFTIKEIPAEWIDPVACSSKNDALHFPDKNRYISDTFTLHPADPSYGDIPTLVKDTSKAKMWYKPDRKFLLPKADINFMLITPVCHESNFHLMCADILDYILDFELEELCCEASITELHVSQNSGGKCHCISINGFNDKLFLLFKDVVDLMASFKFSETAFNVSKEQLERDHRNALIKSEELNGTLKHLILRNVALNPIQSLKELSTLTPEQLLEFYKRYFSHMFVESLFQGNITKDEAEKYMEYLCTAFQYKVLPPEQFPEVRTLGLPLGRTVCRHNVFNKKDPNSVIHNYYEVGAPTLRLFNVCSLLQHVMEEPLFNTLRTKQQLGYTVYCSCEYSAGGILAYSITVETDSDKFTADEIDKRIEAFLRTFNSTIEEEKDYEKYVESYIKLLKQADLSVSDEAGRNWSEIYYQDYIFDRRYRSIEMVKQIDKSELLAFMKKYLLDEENVRMLSVQVIGATEEEEEEEDEEEEGEEGEDGGDDEGDEGYEDGYEYEYEEEPADGGEEDNPEEEDDEEDEYYDDEESDEDVENLQDCTIDLLDVAIGQQYTRAITDIDAFRDAHPFHPFTRLLLE